MTTEQWTITWHDSGREPQGVPDPAFPQGCLVDLSHGAARTCDTPVPYPARRCGYYVVECQRCGFRGAMITAGRPDDPYAVRVACRGPWVMGDSTRASRGEQ
jgi:hypothetical protein